jgi:hypothetical protein
MPSAPATNKPTRAKTDREQAVLAAITKLVKRAVRQ